MTGRASIDEVWSRVKRHEGETFRKKRGEEFTYTVSGSVLRPSCAKQNLPRSEFAKALAVWPLDGPGAISNLVRGSAYIWAILHDGRILGAGIAGDDVPVAPVVSTTPTISVSVPARDELSVTTGVTLGEPQAEGLRLESAYSSFTADLQSVRLEFQNELRRDIFGQKNNKTLRETLAHSRYSKLYEEVAERFTDELHSPLGLFLMRLKESGDPFYLRFLNPYGDLEYCTFRIADSRFLGLRGIYAYTVGAELVYIGRCRDTMNQRVNQGYGSIHPKNCYLDGQATNCHLNAEIAKVIGSVALWMHPMDYVPEIEEEERHLLRTYRPPWNVQLA